MGILNVTPDSFSEQGLYFDRKAAIQRGVELAREGADILDIGGESTRPGAKPVSAEEELEGLDISEHGGVAYPDFETLSHGGGISVPTPSAGGLAAELLVRPSMSPVNQLLWRACAASFGSGTGTDFISALV